ncbi:MAG: PQQ-like beta-propeller repeat protein [Saprospiraceae bacterium]|nr:PQQ-like beta-propeller repeat protein [Saprospiraceae bacterium]
MDQIQDFSFTFYFLVVSAFLIISCSKTGTEVAWEVNLPRTGSQSSIRTSDLNNDGVLDIVMGAGENEFIHSKQGILAFDGQTGAILWQQEAKDQVFGSATFYDVNDDGIEDVFIGGRSCLFHALDGGTGKVLWQYDPDQFVDDAILGYARFNFYNSVIVPDQNNDGYLDVLVQNGGNSKIGPGIKEGRFPGVLMLFDSRTGSVLAADTMPDGMESYMSPLYFTQKGSDEQMILFGSGGETFSGNLYLSKLSDLLDKNLSVAMIIAQEEGHGFIAPPVLADINDDGFLDIVAISHASNVSAIDGRDHKLLWKQSIPETECSNSFAVGHFTGDGTPDFFTFVSKGTWPNNTGSLQVLLDGSDGQIIYQNALGCTGFSSPVAYDLNRDGRDEAIVSINVFNCSEGFSGDIGDIENKLMAIDFASGSEYIIEQRHGFKNIFTTPWIGDLDGDGYLDMIHCQYYHNTPYITAFMGMQIKRIRTHIKMLGEANWGAYMGSNTNGIYWSDN